MFTLRIFFFLLLIVVISVPKGWGQSPTLTINASTGGSVTGAGSYSLGDIAVLTATPSTGYLFTAWSGDLISSEANTSLLMDADKEVNATFAQDTADNDLDGLTNYEELVTHSTDPDDSDSDQDTLTDAEEIQIGTNPNIANTALISFYTAREATARSEGNTSGIAHAQTNYSSYQLYNEAEKNASDDGNYSLGLSDGNASGVAHAQANHSQYDLFTSKEKAESDNLAKGEGKSEMLEKVEADFASDGLSLVTYLEEMKKAVPYTNQWFYQPEMGWMWTDKAVFPLVFFSSESEESAGWLYFSQLPDQPAPSFYDYAKEIWVTPAGSQN